MAHEQKLTRNVSRDNPCPICGKPDMCFYNDRFEKGIVRVCGRVSKDRVNGFDGRTYKMIGTPSTNSIGTYTRYVDEVEDQIRDEERRKAWCLEHGYAYKPAAISYVSTSAPVEPVIPPMVDEDSFSDALPNDVIGRILKKWLTHFSLTRFHQDKLMEEWKNKPGLAEDIFDMFCIKSMPPRDKELRYHNYWRMKYQGKSRGYLIQKLVEICHEEGLPSPAGIPGIYYDEKEEQWEANTGSGILYPCYDVEGNIWRFRIGLDHPEVKGIFAGKEGYFNFYGDSWYFTAKGSKESVRVWRYGHESSITLTKKGLPEGKVENKYINFSSSKQVHDEERNVIFNKYLYGARSGTAISIYRPKVLKSKVVWFTEGEKKAMVIAATYGCVVVCVPGVNNIGILFEGGEDSIVSRLYKEGFRSAVVAYDADKEHNGMVSKGEIILVRNLKENRFTTFITKWSIAFGKGIDDSIINGIMPQIIRVE